MSKPVEKALKLIEEAIDVLADDEGASEIRKSLRKVGFALDEYLDNWVYFDDYEPDYEYMHDPGYVYDLTHEEYYEPYQYEDEYYDYAEFIAEMERDAYED